MSKKEKEQRAQRQLGNFAPIICLTLFKKQKLIERAQIDLQVLLHLPFLIDKIPIIFVRP
jgi:hypothetical protein